MNVVFFLKQKHATAYIFFFEAISYGRFSALTRPDHLFIYLSAFLSIYSLNAALAKHTKGEIPQLRCFVIMDLIMLSLNSLLYPQSCSVQYLRKARTAAYR